MLEISFDWETIFSPERVMYLLWHISVLQEHNLSHHIDVRGFEKTDYSTIWDSAQIKRWSKRQFKFYEQSVLVAEGCMVHIIYVIKGLFFKIKCTTQSCHVQACETNCVKLSDTHARTKWKDSLVCFTPGWMDAFGLINDPGVISRLVCCELAVW